MCLSTVSGMTLCYSVLLRVFYKSHGNLTSATIQVVVNPLVALMNVRLMKAGKMSAGYVGEVDDETESNIF